MTHVAAHPRRLDADRRRIQASRDVMTVLDALQASSTTAGRRVDDVAAGKAPTECNRVLVVLFVHSISPIEHA